MITKTLKLPDGYAITVSADTPKHQREALANLRARKVFVKVGPAASLEDQTELYLETARIQLVKLEKEGKLCSAAEKEAFLMGDLRYRYGKGAQARTYEPAVLVLTIAEELAADSALTVEEDEVGKS